MKQHGDFLGRAPRIRVPVTAKNIKDGMARNSNHCMIVDAIRAAYPGLTHVSVDLQTIRASDKKKGERYVWLTPRIGQVGLIKFDQGMKMSPFTFECREGQVTVSGAARLKKHRKAKLRRSSRGGTNVPERVGGRTPPKMSGQRRAFGLRGLTL